MSILSIAIKKKWLLREYIYIVCVCVYVCVRERERDRGRDRERENITENEFSDSYI